MKTILLTLALFVGTMGAANADEVAVKEVYNGWDAVNKIFIMQDEQNHKFCYIVSNSSGSVGMYCFDKESSK